MRSVLPLAMLLVAAAAPREGCGNGSTPAPYDACAGRACGDACTACPPGAADCFETAVVKACDPSGRCVPKTDGMCAVQRTACAGKACGAPCEWPDLPCLHTEPRCLPPQGPGHCVASGACAQGFPPPPGACIPPPPSWGCVGKKCGDGCGLCPLGTDPANCPVPTFAATACDSALQCVTAATLTCPAGLCVGKKCGDPCCEACASPVAMYCDPSGTCGAGPVTCPP